MERVRALVRKGKSAPTPVVDQQLIALTEHVFCERLPFPRRVVEPATATTAINSSHANGGDDGGGGGYDLWEKAVRSPDPKFKKVTQRRMLQQLNDLLQTYLVACIVRVRVVWRRRMFIYRSGSFCWCVPRSTLRLATLRRKSRPAASRTCAAKPMRPTMRPHGL